MKKFTATDLQERKCTHDEYYHQFVTEQGIKHVKRFISEQRILKSTDEHMNDIPLRKWDGLSMKNVIDVELFKELNNTTYAEHERHSLIWSMGENVCIAKACAREIQFRNKEVMS